MMQNFSHLNVVTSVYARLRWGWDAVIMLKGTAVANNLNLAWALKRKCESFAVCVTV